MTIRTKKDLQSDQWDAIDYLIDNDETLLIAPKGFGKTVVCFTAATELLHLKHLARVLILAPSAVCKDAWAKAHNEWPHLAEYPSLSLAGLTPDKRLRALTSPDIKIIICNFENLAWLVDAHPKWDFDGLIVDELTKLKNVGGSNFKSFRKIITGKNSPLKWRVGATADAMAQESTDIYGQMLVVDGGKRLGRNKENFFANYFMPTNYMQTQWAFQPTKKEALAQVLSDIVYRVDPSQYTASLPELERIEVPVQMSIGAKKAYLELAKYGETMVGDNLVEAPNAGVVRQKMVQLCNGGIYYDVQVSAVDDEGDPIYKTEQRAYVYDWHKIEAVKQIVNSLGSQALIVYRFDFQKKQLINAFSCPVYTASLSKAKRENILDQWNSGDLPVLAVHPRSAGHGLNLQYGNCHTLINMAAHDSNDEDGQIIARIWRRGQQAKKVTVYDVICENTIEDSQIVPRRDDRQAATEEFDSYLEGLCNASDTPDTP